MALAHDLDLLPLIMVIGNLVRLGLAAPALADSADLHEPRSPHLTPTLSAPQGRRGRDPRKREGEVGRRRFGAANDAPSLPPRLALRGAP
jgi:hypothetical protein